MAQYQCSDQEGSKSNTFNLRLLRLSLDGRILNDFYWKTQIQFNGNTSTLGSSPRVVDLFAEWQKYDFFKVKIGQYKRPFTFENPMHPIEQGFMGVGQAVSKLAGFSDRSGEQPSNGRDMGLQIQGDFLKNAAGRHLLHYQLGLFNGQGINTKDVDQRKDLIGGLWVGLERPPMRTVGETRLWYAFFLAAVGYATFRRHRYPWLLSFAALVACVFTCINLFKPEIHSKHLMPALQSYWFVPHVTVYILSYAMLGAATVGAFIRMHALRHGSDTSTDEALYRLMDNLVYTGFGFLMCGMLMGAVWAKEAWGHYWSWDPKETWALITFMVYAVVIHTHTWPAFRRPMAYHVYLLLSFLTLLMTYFGVNYLLGGMHSYA